MGGVKVAVTLAVVGAIVAEWVGGDKGLGVLINLARGSLFDTPLLFATLLTIALMGVTLYLLAVPPRAPPRRRPRLTGMTRPARPATMEVPVVQSPQPARSYRPVARRSRPGDRVARCPPPRWQRIRPVPSPGIAAARSRP